MVGFSKNSCDVTNPVIALADVHDVLLPATRASGLPGQALRRRRLQHDDLAAAQHLRDRAGRRRDVAQVGLVVTGERGGTSLMYASAGGISRCARSRPIATAALTATDRSGSANGISPRLTRSMIPGLTSTPVTSSPPVASETAVGSPI